MKGNTTSSSSAGTGGSRWSPTKEQISMLEGLYMQGLRTPSAQQIQHITDKLRVYGHIEGKNVFYWFQNHKARQRQKHKQDQIAIAHFNRFLHIFPPPHTFNNQNGQSDLGFYCSKVQFRPTHEDEGFKTQRMMAENFNGKRKEGEGSSVNSNNKETLDLFPLHPTGILQEKTPSPNYYVAEKNSTTNNCISGSPFFDFFAGTATCEDH